MFQPFRTKFTGGGINREKSIKTIVMVSKKQICQNSIKHNAHRTGNDNGVEALTTA